LTPDEQAKFRAEVDQSMREMFMIGFCGRIVQWRKDAALLAGIRELAAHTTIIDGKTVATTLAAAAEQLDHPDDGHTDIVCGLPDCEHCHPELVVDEETQRARDLARFERSDERRKGDIRRVKRARR
jgi:hypothetical protein